MVKHDSKVISYVLVCQTVWETTIARVKSQVGRRRSHFAFWVIVRTMFLLAVCHAITSCDFVVIGMILFLLPAMTVKTAILQITAITVVFSLLLSAPEPALLLRWIFVLVRFAPKILPIMRIFTLVSHMTLDFVIEWAPDCLEVEQVKVRVLLHAMQQIYWEFVLTVSKCAQIAKVTALFCALGAEFGLVLLWMIEWFDSIVSLGAERPVRALVGLRILAHLWRVCAKRTPLVLFVVIKALFLIMASLPSARLSLEKSEVEQSDTFLALTATAMLFTFSSGCSVCCRRTGSSQGLSCSLVTFSSRTQSSIGDDVIINVAAILLSCFWCILMSWFNVHLLL